MGCRSMNLRFSNSARAPLPCGRRFRFLGPLGLLLAGMLLVALAGCDHDETSHIGRLEAVWGRLGISEGRFQKPRAITIDRDDHLYIVDMTARIQVFTPQGEFLRQWATPDHATGRPTGLFIDRDGNVVVADTHYYRVLVYSPEGKLLRTLGGTKGQQPGEFGLVTGVAQDAEGNYYVSEYGEYDRIQKFTSDGRFLLEWGGHGSEPGQFIRPQKLAFDEHEHLWVTDSCNHRLQVFDTKGKLLQCWGVQGSAPGELYYPYDLALTPGDTLLVCEYGNHRIQKFTRDGKSLGCWGSEGRDPGQLSNPWGLTRDSAGKVHVLDSGNHRVQCVRID
jgi:DNA-binding beta-propeller fold protein YncE